jgi:hypothetical protein
MMKRFLLLAIAANALAGCSSLGVEPWERDVLAKPEMQGNAVDSAFNDHIYFSKEASSGGAGFGGGGCGCN